MKIAVLAVQGAFAEHTEENRRPGNRMYGTPTKKRT